MRVCRRPRPGRDGRARAVPDGEAGGDARADRRVLCRRAAGGGGRDRVVRSGRPRARLADVGSCDDDAEAGVEARRDRAGAQRASRRPDRVRARRDRGGGRRAALGRRRGGGVALLPHGRDRDRRRPADRRRAAAWARPPRGRPHADPSRSRARSVRRLLPGARRLLGGPRGRAGDRGAVGHPGTEAAGRSPGVGARGRLHRRRDRQHRARVLARARRRRRGRARASADARGGPGRGSWTLLGGYLDTPLLRAEEIDAFLVPPALGDDAGVLGAIALAAGARGET